MSRLYDAEVREHLTSISRRLKVVARFLGWNLLVAWIGPFLVFVTWFVPTNFAPWDDDASAAYNFLGVVVISAFLALISAGTFSGVGVLILNVSHSASGVISRSAQKPVTLLAGLIAGGAMLAGTGWDGVLLGSVFGLVTASVWLFVRYRWIDRTADQ